MALVIITVADVERILRTLPVRGTAKFKFGSDPLTDAMTVADATKFIEAAEARIIGKLGFTPPGTNAMVRDMVAYCAAFTIFISVLTQSGGGDIPEQVLKWEELCETWMAEIMGGEIAGVIPAEEADKIVFAPWSTEYLPLFEEPHTASNFDWFVLGFQWIMPLSETVKLSVAPFTLFVKDADYHLQYKSGEMRIIDGGGISIGDKLEVSYTYRWPRSLERAVPSVDGSRISGASYGRTARRIWGTF